MGRVTTGLERLLEEKIRLLRGRRVGLCCNPTAILPDFRHAADVLRAHPEVRLERLFGPEHGVRGSAQDMVAVREAPDPDTGCPAISLYGADEDSLKPHPQDLNGLDVLVFDIQDIGSRYYTYIYTLAFCIEACAAAGVQVMVCDRPNPIRGDRCEGNRVDTERYRSFVGRFPLPNRHGLTAGELAPWFCDQMGIATDRDALIVIPCRGWQRSQWYDTTGLPWVLPSPNMPTLATATVYPGQCLLEGTNLSEGRGTTKPFELFGAPWVRPRDLKREADRLKARWGLEGMAFRPCVIEPTFHKHSKQVCGALQVHVTDRDRFQSLATGVLLLLALKRLYPRDFAWRTEPYEFVADRLAIDLLCGDTSIRDLVDGAGELPDLFPLWRSSEQQFSESVRQYLLYE